MKKLDKKEILSKEYAKWNQENRNKKHPKYSSSNFKYYLDIKMSLLYIQDGLCAYTEQMLCDKEYIQKANWDNTKYNKILTQGEKDSIQGDLEHFDESLKDDKAYLWDNLFVVATHNNCRIKGTKPIKDILKPDSDDYDPFKYLDFDFETGVFFPNNSLSNSEKEDVEYMIITLGINCISSQRQKYLGLLKNSIEVGLEVNPYQYHTAWEMYIKSTNE